MESVVLKALNIFEAADSLKKINKAYANEVIDIMDQWNQGFIDTSEFAHHMKFEAEARQYCINRLLKRYDDETITVTAFETTLNHMINYAALKQEEQV